MSGWTWPDHDASEGAVASRFIHAADEALRGADQALAIACRLAEMGRALAPACPLGCHPEHDEDCPVQAAMKLYGPRE